MALEMVIGVFVHLFFTWSYGPLLKIGDGTPARKLPCHCIASIQDPIRKDLDGRTRVVRQKDKLK